MIESLEPADINPNKLTPKEALEILCKLRALLR
jgi:hypothetical protein